MRRCELWRLFIFISHLMLHVCCMFGICAALLAAVYAVKLSATVATAAVAAVAAAATGGRQQPFSLKIGA